MRLPRFLAPAAALLGAACLQGCPSDQPDVELSGQVSLTLLHTSDIHSRLFPYDFQISTIDAQLGLGPDGTVQRIGGAAKVSHVIGRERARSERVLHLDGGDCFQGAPIFNLFAGEAEIKVLSQMGTDAMIVANHEFDRGPLNLGEQIQRWATFPVLAANYDTGALSDPKDPGLGRVLVPWTAFNVKGLKVGVIGLGNLSTVSSLFEQPNSLGITPLETVETAQFYVDLVRPFVDVVVLVTHLGLEVDQDMIARTSGIDVVLGGHNHIVLQPPKSIDDCQLIDEDGGHYINVVSADAQTAGEKPKYKRRRCIPRRVLLAHSGAFAKYVGRLDLVVSNQAGDFDRPYDPIDRFDVVDAKYDLIPINESVPDDPSITEVLEPYRQGLRTLLDLDLLVGYAPTSVSRSSSAGGDSPLGNMVADAAWLRQGVQTDFALTNTTGIRAAIPAGPVTMEQMFNVFPFDNSIAKMQLSGVEVQEMFDFSARRAVSRGCTSQVQIAGARVVFNCEGCLDRKDLATPCQTDDDCLPTGQCIANPDASAGGKVCRVACAEAIYIGVDDKRTCTSDADCGGAIGACDAYNVDSSGLGRCFRPIVPTASYELATSNYLATGGSGFSMLRRNTTQFDTGIQQRDALIDFIRQGRPCGYDPSLGTSDGLRTCDTDADCGGPDFACACTGQVTPSATGQCLSSGSCGGAGRCVLRACRDDVAAFHRTKCDTARNDAMKADCEAATNPCEIGGEECKFLACLDRRVGNFSDGRILMVGR